MKIKIFTLVSEIQNFSDEVRREGKSIGLVPTMGFLHQGHLSLVQECKNQCDITVVSIFVNPTQFAPNEDLSTYPRDFERDKKLLEENNVDVIFYPSVDEIYSYNFQTYVENNRISKILEGEFRPTHFRGVATIVTILFNCVKPHKAFSVRKIFSKPQLFNK